jgi:hypothetical protein
MEKDPFALLVLPKILQTEKKHSNTGAEIIYTILCPHKSRYTSSRRYAIRNHKRKKKKKKQRKNQRNRRKRANKRRLKERSSSVINVSFQGMVRGGMPR